MSHGVDATLLTNRSLLLRKTIRSITYRLLTYAPYMNKQESSKNRQTERRF
jgi:hypothetical protein